MKQYLRLCSHIKEYWTRMWIRALRQTCCDPERKGAVINNTQLVWPQNTVSILVCNRIFSYFWTLLGPWAEHPTIACEPCVFDVCFDFVFRTFIIETYTDIIVKTTIMLWIYWCNNQTRRITDRNFFRENIDYFLNFLL